MDYGFFRVAACVPAVSVADCKKNVDGIISMLGDLAKQGVRLAVFPEMCVTAYTCADLFHNRALLAASMQGVKDLIDASAAYDDLTFIVGAPFVYGSALYNCAFVISQGFLLGIVPKTYLPNYNEFYEERWWNSSIDLLDQGMISIPGLDYEVYFGDKCVFDLDGVKVGVEICEDLWTPIPPSSYLSLSGAHVVVNLSASDDLIGKYVYLKSLVAQQSARCLCGYVYASAGYGESSTDLVFDGKALVAENGTMLGESQRWQSHPQYVITEIDIDAIEHDRMRTNSFQDSARNNVIDEVRIIEKKRLSNYDTTYLHRPVNPLPFVPPTDEAMKQRCNEILNIQAAGLAKRLDFIKCDKLVVGISGGLDSTLALLVATKTYDRLGLSRKGIIGVTMPGFGTTDRTHDNAVKLMGQLGVTSREVSIAAAVEQHFKDIGQDKNVHDVTYENSQARERTQILMDIANKEGGIVLGTGDLSELALGWATYNGDHMSMYGVNVSIPKTLVKYLVRYFANDAANAESRETLLDIIDTPISPELIPADSDGNIVQKTEDLVGPYELHDFFLYYMLRYGYAPSKVYFLAKIAFVDKFDDSTILKWLRTFYRRFFQQQFKRSCMPDGPKVGSVCLSPRGDWRMPSDASAAIWLKEVDELK